MNIHALPGEQRPKDLRKLPCNDCIARHLPCRSVPDDKCVHCKSWGRNCSHVTGAPRPTPAPPRPVSPAVPPPPLPPPAALVLSRAVPSPARPPNLSLPPRPSTSASVATVSGVNSTAPSTSAIGQIPAGETEVDPKCAMCTMYKKTCTTKVLGGKCSQCAASGWSCSLVCYRCRQMNAKCTAKKDEPCVECVKKKRNCSLPRPTCDQCKEPEPRSWGPRPLVRPKCHTDKWGVACNMCKANRRSCSLDTSAPEPGEIVEKQTTGTASHASGSAANVPAVNALAAGAKTSVPAKTAPTAVPMPQIPTVREATTVQAITSASQGKSAATATPLTTTTATSSVYTPAVCVWPDPHKRVPRKHVPARETQASTSTATTANAAQKPSGSGVTVNARTVLVLSSITPAAKASTSAAATSSARSSRPLRSTSSATTAQASSSAAPATKRKTRLRIDTTAPPVADTDSPLSALTSLGSASRSPSPMLLATTPPTSAGSPDTPLGAKRKRAEADEGARRPAPAGARPTMAADDVVIDLTRSPSPGPRRLLQTVAKTASVPPVVAAPTATAAPPPSAATAPTPTAVRTPAVVPTAAITAAPIPTAVRTPCIVPTPVITAAPIPTAVPTPVVVPTAVPTAASAPMRTSAKVTPKATPSPLVHTEAAPPPPTSAPQPQPQPRPPPPRPSTASPDLFALGNAFATQFAAQMEPHLAALGTRLATLEAALGSLEGARQAQAQDAALLAAAELREAEARRVREEERRWAEQQMGELRALVVREGAEQRRELEKAMERCVEGASRRAEARVEGIVRRRVEEAVGRVVDELAKERERRPAQMVNQGVETSTAPEEQVSEGQDAGGEYADSGQGTAENERVDKGLQTVEQQEQEPSGDKGKRREAAAAAACADSESAERRAAKRARLEFDVDGTEGAPVNAEASPSAPRARRRHRPGSTTALEDLALQRIDEYSTQQTAYLQSKFGEFVGQCEDTTTQLWQRSSAVLKNLTKMQNSTIERLRAGVQGTVGAEVARLNREFGRLEGLAMRRIDDRIAAGQTQRSLGLYDTKKEGPDGVYTLSSKVSDQVGELEDEAEDEDKAGYQLRSAVF